MDDAAESELAEFGDATAVLAASAEDETKRSTVRGMAMLTVSESRRARIPMSHPDTDGKPTSGPMPAGVQPPIKTDCRRSRPSAIPAPDWEGRRRATVLWS